MLRIYKGAHIVKRRNDVDSIRRSFKLVKYHVLDGHTHIRTIAMRVYSLATYFTARASFYSYSKRVISMWKKYKHLIATDNTSDCRVVWQLMSEIINAYFKELVDICLRKRTVHLFNDYYARLVKYTPSAVERATLPRINNKKGCDSYGDRARIRIYKGELVDGIMRYTYTNLALHLRAQSRVDFEERLYANNSELLITIPHE